MSIGSRETGVRRTVLTDARGGYQILGLWPGTYDIAVRAVGFRQQRAEGVRLVVGQPASLATRARRNATVASCLALHARRAAARRTVMATGAPDGRPRLGDRPDAMNSHL